MACALAGERDRRRLVARRAARLPRGPLPLLGRELRLADERAALERAAAVPHDDRRPRDPLSPCPLTACGRAAPRDHPRLAGVDRRVPQGHRSARRPAAPRRRCRRRLPRGLPVAARLRLQRQAKGARLGHRKNRRRLGFPDGPARVHAVRSAGQRLGHQHQRLPGAAGSRARGRHPPDTTAGATRSGDPRGSERARTSGAGFTRALGGGRTRATRKSTPPGRRRSATPSSTHRPRSAPGSSRSSTPGPTTTGISRASSPATSCSTT